MNPQPQQVSPAGMQVDVHLHEIASGLRADVLELRRLVGTSGNRVLRNVMTRVLHERCEYPSLEAESFTKRLDNGLLYLDGVLLVAGYVPPTTAVVFAASHPGTSRHVLLDDVREQFARLIATGLETVLRFPRGGLRQACILAQKEAANHVAEEEERRAQERAAAAAEEEKEVR